MPDSEGERNHESREPGAPGWPWLAFRALRAVDAGGGEAVARLRRLLSAAVVRDCARRQGAMVHPETKIPANETTAGDMMALGAVLRSGV